MELDMIVLSLLFILVLYLDTKYKLIPNWLTGSAILLGWIIAIFEGGFSTLLQSLLGTVIGFLLLLLPFILGGVGGGDVKFLAAIGSLTKISFLMQIVLVGLVIGGILSFYIILKNSNVKGIKQVIYYTFYRKYFPGASTPTKKDTIPLGSCISLAGLLLIGIHILG
jgi:prepilin peptidase CpaA